MQQKQRFIFTLRKDFLFYCVDFIDDLNEKIQKKKIDEIELIRFLFMLKVEFKLSYSWLKEIEETQIKSIM